MVGFLGEDRKSWRRFDIVVFSLDVGVLRSRFNVWYVGFFRVEDVREFFRFEDIFFKVLCGSFKVLNFFLEVYSDSRFWLVRRLKYG